MIFIGGLDQLLVNQSDNPGALLQNQDGTAEFTADIAAVPFDYRQYNVQGIGVGDLNLDGFPDFVTASNYIISDQFITAGSTIAEILIPGINNPESPDFSGGLGSAFDPFDAFYGAWAPLEAVPGGTLFFWVPEAAENPAIGQQYDFGRLTVELNSGDNGNNWIAVDTLGAVGLIKNAVMNRDGIGATVKVTPKHGKPVIRPVHVGNYTSAHAKEGTFGLGNAKRADVEVQWTGGVRNKLFGVKRGKRITFPEIPCDFAGQWKDKENFKECVKNALYELQVAKLLTQKKAKRFKKSMLAAFDEFNDDDGD